MEAYLVAFTLTSQGLYPLDEIVAEGGHVDSEGKIVRPRSVASVEPADDLVTRE